MDLWEIFGIVGVACIILEMVVPSLFFLNLAVAGFIVAIISLSVTSIPILIFIYIALAIFSVLFLRPILIKNKKETKEQQTGMESKYIGQTVKAIEDITKNSGAITIYDERWDARTLSDELIPSGSEVKILKNESLIMFVEKA